MHVRVHVHTHTHMHVHMCVCVCACTHAFTHAFTRVDKCRHYGAVPARCPKARGTCVCETAVLAILIARRHLSLTVRDVASLRRLCGAYDRGKSWLV